MPSEINTIVTAMQTALDTISGLKVVLFPEVSTEFPLAVVRWTSKQAQTIALGGRSNEGRLLVTVFTSVPGSTTEAFEALYEFISETHVNSIEAAVDSDNTLGSAVDSCRLVAVGDLGMRDPNPGQTGGEHPAANWVFDYIVSRVGVD